MGRFFSNIQIKNNRESQNQFVEELNKAMKKRQLVPATEDDASLTYILAFSKNNQWATLCSADYESGGDVRSDVQWLAEVLKTCCICTSVADSDFSMLELYDSSSIPIDMVVVGNDEDYGVPKDSIYKGKREHWEKHLVSGYTWEQLFEIWNSHHVFTEDALAEMAPLLGMDSNNIVSDYDDVNKDAENIYILYFKESQKESKPNITMTQNKNVPKKLTLNSAFKQVFGEYLEPLGFKKIKGRHPYFVRLIDNEILHIVSCMPRPDKKFIIIGGVATVYRQHISLDLSPKENGNWLHGNLHFYTKLHEFDENTNYSFNDLYEFGYSEESILSEMEHVLNITKGIMLPILDEVVDLEACVEYFNKFGLDMHLYDDKQDFGNKYVNNYYNEGLLYIKTNNQGGIIKKTKERLVTIAYNIEKGRFGYTQKDYDEKYKEVEELKRLKPFNVSELYAKEFAELERRKVANTEILRSYGLEL